MESLYVVGGQQREARPLLARPTWYEYQKGLVLKVDPTTGGVETCLEYQSPPDVRAPGTPPVLFKCATLEQGQLFVCTHSEVLVYEVPSFKRVAYVTHPWFNDLHHVRPTPQGNFLVANTGLDMVLEITPDGEVLRYWGTVEDDPWQRFSRDIDYRKIASTKPHRSHPNYVFYVGDEIWATRFEQKDAISLTHSCRKVPIGVERLHDGIVSNGNIYFTSVKGDVIIVDANTLQIVELIDLTRLHPEGMLLGWCRGLVVDGSTIWVGFSHIRPTKFRENIGWVAHRFRRGRTSHIACYDLQRRECVVEIELESHGLDAVFSVLASPPPG